VPHKRLETRRNRSRPREDDVCRNDKHAVPYIWHTDLHRVHHTVHHSWNSK